MSKGSRYYPLFEHLKRAGDAITLRFAEIEALIGAALPASARAAKAWWSNRDSGTQAAAWMQAGYRVVTVDLAGEQVSFRKHKVEYNVQRTAATIQWDGVEIRALRAHMSLNQSGFADVLGVRQQTVSEWEKSAYLPTRATARHLTRVAEEAGFFNASPDDQQSS